MEEVSNMKISPSLVFYMLSHEIDIVVKRESYRGAEIKMPLLLENADTFKTDTKGGILYICNNVEQSSSHIRSCDALIVIGAEPSDLELDCAYAFVTETPANEVLYRVFEIMQRLHAWDSSLKDACHQGLSLDQVIPLINEVFERSLLLVDNNYNYVAYSKSYFQEMEDMRPEVASGSSQEIIPSALLNDLLLDKEFLSADKQKGVKFYPRENTSERALYINFFKEDRYMARLLAQIGRDEIGQGEEELFAHISRYIEDIYFRRLDEQMMLRQNDTFHANLKSMLLNEYASHPATIPPILDKSSWLEKHEYQVAAIRMFNLREFELSALFLCAQLEDTWTGTAALTLGTEILWVIDNSLLKNPSGSDIDDVIKHILGNYACKAGISGTHSGLHSIHLLYDQAIEALSLGETHDPHYWFYRFNDYKIDHLLHQLTEKYPAEHTVHPGLEKLIVSDKEKGTEYLKYLACYIESGLNTSSAAERIFVHRSTFIRQLARMKELSGIDLSANLPPEELTHILISLVLIETS